MRPLSRSVITLLLTGSTLFVGSSAISQSPSDPYGLSLLPASTTESSVPVVVFLDDQNQQKAMAGSARQAALTRGQRLQEVTARLKSFQPNSHDPVSQWLSERSSTTVTRIWVVPALTATVQVAQLDSIATLPGVKKVVVDLPLELIEPVDSRVSSSAALSHTSHLDMMNVGALWNLGLKGQGRLVCSFDTGVEEAHPALTNNWRGHHTALSAAWFSTVSPTSLPYDKADHGTHTMGTMVGVDGADTIGVAPGAEWITAGVIDQGKSLSGTVSDILGAFQWALNPDGNTSTTDDVPDVILSSWGVPAALFDPCDRTFFQAIDNVEAAGIVCVFAAGNEGPNPSTLRNPASRATSPLNSFSVGAVDNSYVVASFSSRGPGGCGLTAVKPELMAPGVSIRSCAKDGGYKLMSGTSMAAPFIAGLVALCRQYNPDATVEEIKWALLQSCTDLGAEGEDNAYGYGLPDASKLLSYLTAPGTPNFQVVDISVAGGVALPGQLCGITVTLSNIPANVESATGRLLTGVTGVALVDNSIEFLFGTGGTIAVSSHQFVLELDGSLYHGQQIPLSLEMSSPTGQVYDTLSLSLEIGYAPNGNFAGHEGERTALTVSDFGQFGLAPGSIYNTNGLGFTVDNSANLLYEAGIIIGRSDLQVSSAVRAAKGSFTPSDFVPTSELSDARVNSDGTVRRTARFADALAEPSIPVTIGQESIDGGAIDDHAAVVLKYRLINSSLSSLTDLHFGFLADFDLGATESARYDAAFDMIYQQADGAPLVGLVVLSRLTSVTTLTNDGGKTGFTHAQLYDLMAAQGSIDETVSGDLMLLISGGPWAIGPGDSIEVAFALVAGQDLDDLRLQAVAAREMYLTPTDVDDTYAALPDGYELLQNYPNPFNPTTTIGFSLPTTGEATLEILNILGQRVRIIHSGPMNAGYHEFEWDSRTDAGGNAATGVYFYRLTTDDFSQTRKMMLLK